MMDTDADFIEVAECFFDAYGRKAWWEVMEQAGVSTLQGAIDNKFAVYSAIMQRIV